MEKKQAKKVQYKGLLSDVIVNAQGKVISGFIYYRGTDGRVESILGHSAHYSDELIENVKNGTIVKFEMGSYKNPKTNTERITAVNIKFAGKLDVGVLKNALTEGVNFDLHVIKDQDIPLYLFAEGIDPEELLKDPTLVKSTKVIGTTVMNALVVVADPKKPTFKILAPKGVKMTSSKIFRQPVEKSTEKVTAGKTGKKDNKKKSSSTVNAVANTSEGGEKVTKKTVNTASKLSYVGKSDEKSKTTIGDFLPAGLTNVNNSGNSASTVQK